MASEQGDDRLAVVGGLCELALAARRLGCRIVLAEGRSDLIDLIEHVGLDGPLLGRSRDNDTETGSVADLPSDPSGPRHGHPRTPKDA
jgi:hypothetical protein